MKTVYCVINFIVITIIAVVLYKFLGVVGSLVSFTVTFAVLFAAIYNYITFKTFGYLVVGYFALGLVGTLFGWIVPIGIIAVLLYVLLFMIRKEQ